MTFSDNTRCLINVVVSIQEPIYYTKNSEYLINLSMVTDKIKILTSGVYDEFTDNQVCFHCPALSYFQIYHVPKSYSS